MLQQKKNNKGFTIIEVLIVLAIAGLIMLVVFLAVPALQRNSRNTQRKNDVQLILGGINEYASNNNGANPTTLAAAQQGVKTSFYQTADITFATNNTAIASPNTGGLYLNIGAKCNATNDNVGGTGANSRSVAIVYSVETSSGSAWRCQEG